MLAPVYFKLTEDQTEFPIEAPERIEPPKDYGEADIRIDAKVKENDHNFIYVDGKTNLLEGVELRGKYYPKEDSVFYDGFLTKTYVQPDGTFRLPIKYDSITHDGYIDIRIAPSLVHRTTLDIEKAYGKKFENLTGDYVEEVKDHKEILLTIDAEGMDIDIPDDAFASEDDGELKIQVPDDVLFDFDKSSLKAEAKDSLKEIVDILKDLDDDTAIEINGHTDNTGDADYNLKLSEERATSVEKFLADNDGLDHLSVEINGYGETKPIASNATDEGKDRNRRVEIVIEGFDE